MLNKQSSAWLCLIIAGALEIVWAYFMKLSCGFTVLVPTVVVIICLVISFFLLGRAVNVLGIGLSYAVFTGIGIAGTTIIGIFLLNETANLVKIISLIVLLVGIIGLKFAENAESNTSQKEGK